MMGKVMQKLDEFIQRYPLRKFDKDQLLLVQDERPRDIFYVKSGFIKGYDINIDGIEQHIWLGSKGDIIPYEWLFSAVPSTQLFYSAFTYLEVYVVNRQELLDFFEQHPDVMMHIAKDIAMKLSELTEKLTATEKPKASEKIVYMLNILAKRFGTENAEGDKSKITVPLTQQDIANLLGLTRETVATELKKLKDKDFVYYDKWQFVVHTDKLAELM
jgi:CRP/FNR family cyclic AMP-dependent transcriptional regulator